VYALVALGYTLVYGILELINFAHGDVFMLGALISASMMITNFGVTTHSSTGFLVISIIGSLLVAMLACGVINATIEFVAYRPLRGAPRLAPLITAIGVSFILEDIAIGWKQTGYTAVPNVLPKGNVFAAGGVSYTWEKLIVVMITVPVLVALVYLVQRTRQGKAMRATAQDRDAAAMMGINVNRTISFTFLIAGGLAGAGGLVYALYFGQVRYDTGYQLGLIAFTAAVLGGIGNLPGAVLGALCIGFIQAFNEGLRWHSPGSDWTESIVFSILILILVFRPEGLLGERTPEGG
jgi:branched-chain amino acid transport system permease protein